MPANFAHSHDGADTLFPPGRASLSNLNFILAIACLLATLPMSAVGAAAGSAPEPIPAPSLFFSAMRVAGAMAVVVACFLGGVWLFRNWQRFAIRGARTPKLHVLETKSLGPRHGLYIVAYEQQRFLIASAPTGISMLSTLPPGAPDEVQAPAAIPQFDFASVFSRTLSFAGKTRTSQA